MTSGTRNKPHIMVGGAFTVRMDNTGSTTSTYPGAHSSFKGWRLSHEVRDAHNTRAFAVTLHGPANGAPKIYRLEYTRKGHFKILNHNYGPHYLSKEVRKWVRSEYTTLYVKARLAGWPGIHGRN